ncbi:anthranilate synthase component I [Alteribacter lacisalsi]|uniref:Anthranilate synthase component 1 n=1 Tax=Alteribacter lacisalsi TaxID=2045244 RepID=A0A2W0HEJ0_9BACI|nr:anthranilate synthase component I family protein [Alteribacter lacisalsi]PYZ98420.1 anthranilate synthase component I [Alteribacter lacisalsi]
MIQTSRQSFARQAAQHKTVPVTARLVADTLTPIQLFETFNKRAAFLLESRDPLSLWSEYSFIGIDPFLYLTEENSRFTVKDQSGIVRNRYSRFTEAWDRTAAELDVSPELPDLPFPGGAVGSFSFEAMNLTEDKIEKGSAPAASFVFCETILAFHHSREELTIIHFQEVGSDADGAFELGKDKVEAVIGELSGRAAPVKKRVFETFCQQTTEDIFSGVKSNVTKEAFIDKVRRVKNYIESGDAFQVVLSQRFEVENRVDGLDLYRVLRKQNPSPYMFYIRAFTEELVGSSPERLVKIEADRSIDIHPIAGTRKRGKDDQEDKALEADLLADEKERAEHFMLVDLARNDLGRVCQYGTVETYEKMTITRFSKVMHIISKVKGKLRPDVHPIEAVLSAHPAGTVSGAPKIRAVEIIQELEADSRDSYAGTVAYLSFNGTIDSCIAIRTIRLQGSKAFVQAGAGVVYDSVPELEWEETRNKASALLSAVSQAKKSFEQEESVR